VHVGAGVGVWGLPYTLAVGALQGSCGRAEGLLRVFRRAGRIGSLSSSNSSSSSSLRSSGCICSSCIYIAA
jgi:hypothetical protein